MLSETFNLYPYNLVQLIFAFVAGYGALLIWEFKRYRMLAVFLISQSMLMLLNYYEGIAENFLVTPLFTLTKGPLMYLFIRGVVNERKQKTVIFYSHFLPVLLVPLLLGSNGQTAIIAGSISQIVYLMASFKLPSRYNTAASSFRSDANSLSLKWLIAVFGLFMAQSLIGLVRLNLQRELAQGILNSWYTFDLTFLLGLCCFIIYKVIKRPLLYDEMLEYESVSEQPVTIDKELELTEAGNIFEAINTVILEEKLYKQPRLCVADITNETGLQAKDISWAVNLAAEQNFNGYINRLRVNAFKGALQANKVDKKSLLDLAFEVGFNSKSSFNSAFKHEVGMTPTQYIKTSSYS